MKQNVLMQAKQLTRSITVYIQLGLRGAGDPSRACHVCVGEVAGVRSPASSPWWLGFLTPFMERGLVLGLEAPEVLCFEDRVESYLEYPLGCTCACTHTAHMYEFAWEGGDDMEIQCWGPLL